MKTTLRVASLTLEHLRADIEQGIIDDRPETFAPLDAYGPPTKDEVRAEQAARANADGAAANGRAPKGHSRGKVVKR